MRNIRNIFYDMEKHYINVLNLGEEYYNKMIDVHVQLAYNIKQQIFWLQNESCTLDEIYNLKQQLAEKGIRAIE